MAKRDCPVPNCGGIDRGRKYLQDAKLQRKVKCVVSNTTNTCQRQDVTDEDLATKIKECQTIAELTSLESQYVVREFEKSLVFEKKLELIGRLLEEGTQDEQLEFPTNLTGPWALEQRQQFELEWWELVDPWRKT